MIDAHHHMAVLAGLLALAACGFAFDRCRLGRNLSGAALVLVGAIALSNVGIMPHRAPVYDVVWDYLVPLAIPLLLLHADLRTVLRESGRTLVAFAAASAATLAGVFAAVALVPLGQGGSALAGMFSATYIGGSVNFAAVAETLAFRDSDRLSAAVAADNLGGALYLVVMAALAALPIIWRFFPQSRLRESAAPGADSPSVRPPLDAGAIAGVLAISAAIVVVSRSIAEATGKPEFALLYATAIVVMLATVFAGTLSKLQGGYQVGTVLLYVFFGAIGAGADAGILVTHALDIAAFVGIVLGVHVLLVLALGRLLRLGLPEIVIGSNAAVFGPAPASALAAAKGWPDLVTPAVLCGVLGYAIANFIGVSVATFLAG